MNPSRLKTLLKTIPDARIGVVGDFCVDSYYIVDGSASEPSLETGLDTRPVREQQHSLGGAGNVVANLRALGVKNLRAFGVMGPDIQGSLLLRLLGESGAVADGLILQGSGWQTHCYLKPIVDRGESNRLDFGLFNVLDEAVGERVLAEIEKALPSLDVLVVNQQFRAGLHTPAFRHGLEQLLQRTPRVKALVDCRDLDDAYGAGLRKLNDLEALRRCGSLRRPGEPISRREAVDAAEILYKKWRRPLFVTRGKYGCLVYDEQGLHEVLGLHIIKRTDPVGAGDSMVAGIAACLAVGASPEEAATFGNFVAGVTVQILDRTGTASPAQVLEIGECPDYVYKPELAEDSRQAAFHPETDVEIVEPLPSEFAIRYAIFDHDGTISTLRQGWERVMEPMMIEAILGSAYESLGRADYDRVARQVVEFIDKTTGIQTLQQMHGLAQMVREAGYVPEHQILDAAGYKRIYNDALMRLVADRLGRLKRGELGVEDFTVKNAVRFLERLHAKGVRLYLASGTDEHDVLVEAKSLGYASLFEGRIYGANHDMTHDAKRMVLERILGELGVSNAAHIATFGDGPVEIRETRKRGGLTVGIASNEIQRFGLQPEKRARVIRAGANLVTPDFSQLDALLGLLRLN